MRVKVRDFSLDKTLDAGQTFGWSRVGKSWVSFFDVPLVLAQKDSETLEFSGASKEKVQEMLGLNDDIEGIRAEIDRDDFIDKAINFSKGIRVVKDGLWPSALGFILSIQSNVPLITRRIKLMSSLYGKTEEINGIKIKSFPSYESIHDGGKVKLKAVKSGFRERFILSAANYFYSHELSESLEPGEIKVHLSNILGIGDKVMDCILLYGLHDLSAFPMDVWILRAVQEKYGNLISGLKKYKDKRNTMVDYFGRYAGYAQLFIYFYYRSLWGQFK